MTESFVIQSNVKNIPVVEERLFLFCQECHVCDCFSAVSVATLQAVTNAIVHGNESNEAKAVNVSLGTCRGGIFVEVTDEGRGFDHGRYGNLTVDGEVSGEGIFVMKSLSDEMEYYDGGRRVRMEFKVYGIAPTDAMERIAILKEYFSLVAA